MIKRIQTFLYQTFHRHTWTIIQEKRCKYTNIVDSYYETCPCGMTRELESDYGYGVELDYVVVNTYRDETIKKKLLIEKLTK